MSNLITSSSPSNGTNFQLHSGSARSLYPVDFATNGAAQLEPNAASLLPMVSNTMLNETSYGPDKSVAELAIRRLSKEIDIAKEELQELEATLVQELHTPPARAWLLPLMVAGLLLSLYGSVTSSDTAELGATGLMLLWSLSAFWFVYTRDMRLEKAKNAHKAEIEIWTSRINELERSLEQHLQGVEQVGR